MNFFSEQPPILKAAVALLTCGVAAAIAVFDYRIFEIIAVCAVLLAGLLAGYHFFLRWRESRKSSALRGQIQQHSSAAPNTINDPAKRARLDDLKRNFETGLEKFRSSGKDVYKLPWYLIVGEPGSGKTEAVRHCNVGFPPGLQDELQGVGGTINMNWWFTNQAVLLDTAGRLMFEEVKPGESSEWREFLQLLRRNRPNCPINGLLLVIPADSLIRDSGDVLYRKAGKIAQQLDLIQRTLDIRFPVFVLVTKCDLLNGFREFFDEFQDTQTQHQIVGWSNPEPRDTIFNPGLVERYLEGVIQRVKKRRLGLLRDPVPQANGAKRMDEVDSLFALPQSFALITPHLRTYLENIFVAGEWSAKPLFLRGIYFTSAMREGEALDQELAQAMGLSVDDLPEGRAWERERAYFLRDLFTEKVFRERGLVTRASNTKVLLRRRQAILLGFCAIAALVWLGLTFYGINSLRESVGRQTQFWLPAARDWERGIWHPIVQPAAGKEAEANLIYNYKGDTVIEGLPLPQYHNKMRELSTGPIRLGWVFKPLARLTLSESERQHAQRILFEGGVVKPLLEAARARMQDRPIIPPEAGEVPVGTLMLREAVGVAALIRLESAAITRSKKTPAALTKDFLLPLLRYDTESDSLQESSVTPLPNVLEWTYSAKPNGTWPPTWSPEGTATLDSNRSIQAGVDRLIACAQQSLKTQEQGLLVLRDLRNDLDAFQKKERELNTVAVTPGDTNDPNAVATRMESLFGELDGIKQALDAHLKRARDLSPATSDWFGISAAYANLVGESEAQSSEAFDLVQKAAEDYTSRPEAALTKSHALFADVARKLKDEQAAQKRRMESHFTRQEVGELQQFDQQLLADSGDGKALYVVRWNIYESAHRQMVGHDSTADLIGQGWIAVAALKDAIEGTHQALAPIKEKLKDTFAASGYFLDRAEETRVDSLLVDYIRQSRERFDSRIHSPLVSKDGKDLDAQQIEAAGALLSSWKKDLTNEVFKKIQSPRRAVLEQFLLKVDEILARKQSLSGNITVALMGWNETPNKQGLMRFRKVWAGGHDVDTSSPGSSKLDSCPVLGVFRAQFLDFSVLPQKAYLFSESAMDLLLEAKRGGGKVKVRVDGLPIWLEVASDGAPVDLNAPNKASILAILKV